MKIQMWGSSVMLLLLLATETAAITNPDFVKPGCQENCGNISVPYPFGIGELSCAMNEYFFLNCSSADRGQPKLMSGTIPVRNISLLEGTFTVSIHTAFNCFDKSGRETNFSGRIVSLGSGPYMFSDSRNIFTAIGCDTQARVTNREVTFGASCLSLCSKQEKISKENPCSGSGCCKTSIPKGLKSIRFAVSSIYNYSKVSDFNLCGFTFIVEERSLDLSEWQLSRNPNTDNLPNVVIEWAVQNVTCQQAKATIRSYACRTNANCTDTENPRGYRCLCNSGFEGNPYLEQGCQDIDECKDPQKYKCKGRCENTIGDYKCHCPLGMHGDGKTGCQGFGISTIVAAIGAIIFLVVVSALVSIIFTKRRKEKNFRKNGGVVLKHQRIRIFSEAELAKATDKYDDDNKLGEGGFGSVYRGVLDDNTLVAYKKSKGVDKGDMGEDFQHEIYIVSQVNHKNVVKLLGLCLETKVPLLVYEFISNGTLYQHIHDRRSQILASWSNRLRIASESALALDYLHSLADPPVIHGDVKSMNILLDDHHTAKVADFGASVLVSPGQSNIIATKIQGTWGYLDPEYLMTGNLTAKSDVFSFGVVLIELLTGEKPNSNTRSREKQNIIQYFISTLENNGLSRILDFQAADEGELDEIEAVAELVKRCVNSSGTNRPTMKEVSDELAQLKAHHENSWAQQNREETEYLLGESSHTFSKKTSPSPSQSQTVISFEMDNYSSSI